MRRASTEQIATGRRRWVAPAAALAAAALGFAVAFGAGNTIHRTDAAWTDAEVVTGTLTTLKVNPVTVFACNPNEAQVSLLGGGAVPLVWTAPVATADGLAPTSYLLSWSGTAGSGSAEVAGNVTSYSISMGVLALGQSSTVTITAKWSNGSTTWLAATSPAKTYTITTVLGLLNGYRCS
ncbi:hypothetical protein [Schumannella sp. 10F1B-5-1]|uniref:hypothetical protein n=1 Tax=Schumannella sp. 10F1B-5-1 TaxID=2590780 RepID=UPI0011327743|nr:hypothetical protein [Schumannella sp. 10F1B-5-1]TPW76818.1 hypothetical protein FJ658_02440 [Schumannella sp. 10F1B-5-1]